VKFVLFEILFSVDWYKDNFNNWPDAELALVPHPVLKPTVTPK
jgi:hypothetical protein